MEILSFDNLLDAARAQPSPQRLLLLFLRTELQKDATLAERQGFDAGRGGALEPLSSVDLAVADVPSFASLQREADARSAGWDKLLVACIDESGEAPQFAKTALQQMTARVQTGGHLSDYLLFNRSGIPLQLA